MDETLNQGNEQFESDNTGSTGEEYTESSSTGGTPSEETSEESNGEIDPLEEEGKNYGIKEEESIEEKTEEDTTNSEEETIKSNEESGFPERAIKEATQEFNATKQDVQKDFNDMAGKYLKKAGRPVVTIMNEETGREEHYYAEYTAQEALEHGMRTEDYDAFLSSLSPLDVKNFLKEYQALEEKWNPKLDKLEKEIKYKNLMEDKKGDLSKWDEYIKPLEKESPAVAHVLNNIKNISGFDKEIADMFKKLVSEAIALDVNKEILQQQSASVKKAMMGSTPIPSKNNSQKIYTNADIKKMSDAYFTKHKGEIERQMKQGLIK